tara:strand:+ start:1320 stop:1553 length:234 start_codon:yes stop_codon:yes gene_type:complete
VDEVLKKIKHLRATFLQYAQERSLPGAWTDELKDDFEIIEQLEFEYGIKKSILPGDMKLCNKLYNKYKIIGIGKSYL